MKFKNLRQQRWFCLLQIVLIGGALMMTLVVSASSGPGSEPDEHHNLKKYLGKLCRGIDSMRHLSDMRAIIVTIRAMGKLPPVIEGNGGGGGDGDGQNPPNDNNNGWSDYWTLGQDPAKLCLENAPAILELGPIVDEKANVCQPSHIDLLEAYKKKYLDTATTDNHHRHRITKRFFNLYTNQVSFICKHNLISSLQLADDKLGKNYAKVMPWLVKPPNECPDEAVQAITGDNIAHNNNNDIESIHEEKEEASSYSMQSNRFHAGRLISDSLINDPKALRCKAIEALSSVKSINELVEVMEKDNFNNDGVPSQPEEGHHEHQSAEQADGGGHASKSGGIPTRVSNMMLIIPDNMRQTVEQMLEACSQFEQIYSQTIIPIVRLIQMGYNPTYKKFDEKCRADILPQRWFSITLICHSMLRSRLADQKSQSDFKEDLADNRAGLIVVDDQIIHRELPSSQEQQQQQQLDGNELVFKNPIEDELWVGKYLPGRFKRFRTRYISNLLEVFKIDKLRNSVVFKKNVKRGRSIIVTLILVGLTLLGINASPSL